MIFENKQIYYFMHSMSQYSQLCLATHQLNQSIFLILLFRECFCIFYYAFILFLFEKQMYLVIIFSIRFKYNI
jgi:hypothetical protein